MRSIGGLAALAGLLALSACVAPVGPVEVTRFHLPEAQARASGPIAVEPAAGTDGTSLEFASYAQAVRRELQRIGYAPVFGDGTTAPQVATVSLTRRTYVPEPTSSPVSVGVGGGTGSYGSSVGVGVGIDLSGKPVGQVETRLAVTIRERATNRALWEGRAAFTVKASSPLATTQLGASRLAEALFRDFPGLSGATIYVP